MGGVPQTIRIEEPANPNGRGIVLTHGAGSNCDTPLLKSVARSFVTAGWMVLRCNMAFREQRQKGPPFPAAAAQDRESLRQAVQRLRELAPAEIYLGGHSYGGRQASMLSASEPDLVSGLVLLSYPLHPPRDPSQVRTRHFPELKTPAVFVHGSRDPFGSEQELRAATALIAGPSIIVIAEGAGHDLARFRTRPAAPACAAHEHILEGLRSWLGL